MDSMDLDIVVDATDEWDYLPFAKKWKETFEQIESILSDNVTANQKEKILNKVAKIIHLLVTQGDTYEDIVLETAQLYLFAKETGADITPLERVYGEIVIAGVKILLSNDLKLIFENKSIFYLGKIKIADYLVELGEHNGSTKINRTLVSEINKVVKNYAESSHKNLMKYLIAAASGI